MSETITSRTRLFALLGDPVFHSFSPVIQNAARTIATSPSVAIERP